MNTDDPRNSGDPLDAIFRAARENAGDFDRLEYGFETRTLARIREERGSSWIAWTRPATTRLGYPSPPAVARA